MSSIPDVTLTADVRIPGTAPTWYQPGTLPNSTYITNTEYFRNTTYYFQQYTVGVGGTCAIYGRNVKYVVIMFTGHNMQTRPSRTGAASTRASIRLVTTFACHWG